MPDPCPTCQGPIRETKGLVCQTCGRDYGAPVLPEVEAWRLANGLAGWTPLALDNAGHALCALAQRQAAALEAAEQKNAALRADGDDLARRVVRLDRALEAAEAALRRIAASPFDRDDAPLNLDRARRIARDALERR